MIWNRSWRTADDDRLDDALLGNRGDQLERSPMTWRGWFGFGSSWSMGQQPTDRGRSRRRESST
jgi:hypothetical protein